MRPNYLRKQNPFSSGFNNLAASLQTFIKVQHASLENHQRPTCLDGDPLKCIQVYSNILIFLYFMLHIDIRKISGIRSRILVLDGSPIRHVGLRSRNSVSDQAIWSPIRQLGLRSGLSVPDGSPMRLVGLRSDVSVSDGSPMRHVGLRSGSLVSDWSLVRHVGLRWVSDQACRSPMGLQ